MPIRTTAEAIREATVHILSEHPDAYVIGEGVNDPKGAFGTTKDLKFEFPGRIWEMPVSENALTGMCIGSAIAGMRPIMVHMRADFLLYAMDQLVNNAAKWHQMFGGRGGSVPLIIRAVVGRGWGGGLQHTQHLESLFAAIPGLLVMCPSNARDAKGMLIHAARQNNPVLFFEHRWIHELKCEVPEIAYEVSGPAMVVMGRRSHGTLAAWGYMVHECVKAAEFLQKQGFFPEVLDLRGAVPGNRASDYILVKERSGCPSSPYLSRGFYPNVVSIMQDVAAYLCTKIDTSEAEEYLKNKPLDVPNKDFIGPF